MGLHAFDPIFLSRPEYYEDLVIGISKTKTGDRVVLATMDFKPELPEIVPIMQELYAAAKRGVNVTLLVDAYIFMKPHCMQLGPLLSKKKLEGTLPQIYQKKLSALHELKAAGGRYVITNIPGKRLSNPYAGRSHMKYAVINDKVYVGGCNLTSVRHTDVMVAWQDSGIANTLCKIADAIITKQGKVLLALGSKDLEFKLDEDIRLLIDVGVQQQSKIYTEAMKLIDSAEKEVILTSQLFPNGATMKALKRAVHRGVNVKVLYNHPLKHGGIVKMLSLSSYAVQKLYTPKSLYEHGLKRTDDFIHAKVLITDKGCMVGSHNLVPSGVKLGTAETALYTNNEGFGKRLKNFVTDKLIS